MTKETNKSVFLNYKLQTAKNCKNTEQSHRLLVFIHGLFGDLHNLGRIARAFEDDYDVLCLDLRNHGHSFHSDEMNFESMATDVKELLEHLNLSPAIVVGHSMGGKVAMKLADIAPHLVEQLVIIDIAPVKYTESRHDAIFAGLFAVKNSDAQNRIQAQKAMQPYIKEQGVQQFMLKSFAPTEDERFLFNLTALQQNYDNISDWSDVKVEKPTLFIKGDLSDYIKKEHKQIVLNQFPQAKLFIVSNADHWVHAVKPEAVIRAMKRVL
ncbi:alpha/beta fold hydrolase [Pasteurella atlantica]|uniref:Alpha/beta fold hydrolase n=2 Tax=Pasteurellaceae TaxID=712 RepID=A0ACC6HMC6_9PAST|nr:alpha/beta fold hydrolase [Pasteurella atlantica]MDP8033505.1 alpha/beta fold hydrolase [Pasteurella atlantica]MDP8035441.1 alpha/beta fold hydrolase [Pasteurella atlantica]MDP8037392.1 alpha/beta fold hydrolase [Pasteurella atlantica]MDP8047740.1 alpha/beta fold hydrolase [Pasteurella atlantica]MDP8049699.1 alpha/beta fold hydrolase [Pasteurella atlantica]